MASDNDDYDDDVLELEMLKVIIHPKNDPPKAYYDVAIIKIERITRNTHVKPVCLPFTSKFEAGRYDNDAAVLTGWGFFNSSSVAASKLNTASVTIYDNE